METEDRRNLTIVWRIQNFSHSKHGYHPAGFRTSVFQPRTFDGRQCFLRLLPNGGNSVPKRLALSLIHQSGGTRLPWALCYPIDCEWSFLSHDGSSLVSGTVRNLQFQENRPLDLPDCPTREDVFETRKSSFLTGDTLTVRCRIWKSRGELPQAEYFSLFTRIETSEHSLVCLVEGFSTLQLGQCVTTPADTNIGCEDIQLKLSLTGATLLDSKVDCEIIKPKNFNVPIMTVGLSLLGSGQNTIKSEEATFDFRRSNTRIILEFASRKELLKKRSECLRGDVLSILCVFTSIDRGDNLRIERTFFGPSNLKRELSRDDFIPFSETSCRTTRQSVDPRDSSPERGSLFNLGEDILSLYGDHRPSDFEILSGDVSYPVHKNVLSYRSLMFKDMFSGDMEDTNFLDVPDVDPHTLNRILTFLYAGIVYPLQWEAAVKLYNAADKFQVQCLKRQCTSILGSGITVSNVSEILTLANRHQDRELTSFVHDFILIRYDEIMASDEWKSFVLNDPGILGKTMHQIYKTKLRLTHH